MTLVISNANISNILTVLVTDLDAGSLHLCSGCLKILVFQIFFFLDQKIYFRSGRTLALRYRELTVNE